jgi:hypothetical protein
MNIKFARVLITMGNVISAIPSFMFPFFLIAGVMSLGAGSESIGTQCTSSIFGAFICMSLSYPVLYVAGLVTTGYLMKKDRYLAAAIISWSVLGLFLILLLSSGVANDLWHVSGK